MELVDVAAGRVREAWPIVVGGCFRSGTSLLRRMLDAHSRIHCGPEVKFFRDFYGDYMADSLRHLRFFTSARALVSESELLDVTGAAFIALHERAALAAGKARWADKNPENVLYLEQWQRLLGNEWLVVHLVRNPLDTLASMQEARFPLTLPPDVQGKADVYCRYHQAGVEFGSAHPDRYLRIVYERLVAEPEATLMHLMTWLGERLEPEQMEFNSIPHQPGLEDPKVLATSRVHAESVGRWNTILTPDEAAYIQERCGRLWRMLSGDLH